MTRERIDAMAEIVAEIWRSGKNDSQVFDYHECSIRQRWVARLNELLRPPPKLRPIGDLQNRVGTMYRKCRKENRIPTAVEIADEQVREQIKGLFSWFGEACAIRGYDVAKNAKALTQILSLLQPLLEQAKAESKREVIDFAGKVLDFAEHGDYSNGIDASVAEEMLDGLRKEWQALQKG